MLLQKQQQIKSTALLKRNSREGRTFQRSYRKDILVCLHFEDHRAVLAPFVYSIGVKSTRVRINKPYVMDTLSSVIHPCLSLA